MTKRTSSSFTHRGVVVDPTIPAMGKQQPSFVKMLFARYYAPFLAKWYIKVGGPTTGARAGKCCTSFTGPPTRLLITVRFS